MVSDRALVNSLSYDHDILDVTDTLGREPEYKDLKNKAEELYLKEIGKDFSDFLILTINVLENVKTGRQFIRCSYWGEPTHAFEIK